MYLAMRHNEAKAKLNREGRLGDKKKVLSQDTCPSGAVLDQSAAEVDSAHHVVARVLDRYNGRVPKPCFDAP